MNKQTKDKQLILKSVSKMIADKEMVRSYIKGKIPSQTLSNQGIKFAKPL